MTKIKRDKIINWILGISFSALFVFLCIAAGFGISNGLVFKKSNEPTYIECGTCGAHVLEWWYIRNDADTEFIEVCSKCYDSM